MRFGWELSLTPSGWPQDTYDDGKVCQRCKERKSRGWSRWCRECDRDKEHGRPYFSMPSRVRYEWRRQSDEDREGAIMRSPGWWPSGVSALSPDTYDPTMP